MATKNGYADSPNASAAPSLLSSAIVVTVHPSRANQAEGG